MKKSERGKLRFWSDRAIRNEDGLELIGLHVVKLLDYVDHLEDALKKIATPTLSSKTEAQIAREALEGSGDEQ